MWICMELLDSSMGQVSDLVYKKLNQTIPEEVLGKMTVAVRVIQMCPYNYIYSGIVIGHQSVAFLTERVTDHSQRFVGSA